MKLQNLNKLLLISSQNLKLLKSKLLKQKSLSQKKIMMLRK